MSDNGFNLDALGDFYKKKINAYSDGSFKFDYEERPVSINEFIEKPIFLGTSTEQGQLIYKRWRDALDEIFESDYKTLIVMTGAIGTGKSTVAVIALAYILYRLLCLKDPWAQFKLAETGKMGICFFNLTKSLGDSRGFGKLQSLLMKSYWFQNRKTGVVRERDKDKYIEFPLFSYLLASPYAKGFGTLGEDVICGMLDEVDSPSESIKQKARVLKAYESTVRRFESRFVTQGQSLGRLFLVASKQDEMSFIDTFVTKMQESGKVLVYDMPLWDVKPKKLYTGVTFPVAVGDAFHPPKILKTDETDEAIQDGYRIINVPVEFKEEFLRDLVGSLRDLAGVTVAGARRRKLFASDVFIAECFDEKRLDPVAVPTIHIGLQDEAELIMYVDLKKILLDKKVARYIHMDIAYTGDALGLAMCGVSDWMQVDIEKEDGTFKKQKVPIVDTDFVMRIKAREGDRIPIHKIRKFVLQLRTLGFRIQKFTSDLRLASEDTLQILGKAGVPAEYVSVDRTDEAYTSLRNLIYEKRWKCFRNERLFFELKHLEHDTVTGKVDHPDEVKDIEILTDGSINEVVVAGSKDVADAVAGSVWACIKDQADPFDVESMKNIMAKAISVAQEDGAPQLTMRDDKGKEIIGVKQGDSIKKLQGIFKKLKT